MTSHKDRHTIKDEMFRQVPCIRIDGEKINVTTHEVIEEIPYALFINGRHAMTAMMSPDGLKTLSPAISLPSRSSKHLTRLNQ